MDNLEIIAQLELVAAQDQFVIAGMAVPYNQLGFPEIKSKGNLDDSEPKGFIFLPGSVMSEGEPLIWDENFDFVITHDPPEGVPVLASKKDFNFTDSPHGLKFKASLDPNEPVAVEVYSALKENKISGNVSVLAKVVDYMPGTITMVAGSNEVSVNVVYVKKAYLQHLAFLGNITPAFGNAMGIAAEHMEVLNNKISVVAEKLLRTIGIVETEEQSDSSEEDITETESHNKETLDPLRLAAVLNIQNKINYNRGKFPIKLKEDNNATT